ncbi:MAG: NTP transferase domain-containing protein [Acidobacteria bacterium]|nr:NTP transferase domain-containing protein [Acidobacteriota bacterium]
MDAVVLVGGLGLRLRPLTETTPKPLLPIGNSCSLDIALHRLADAGAERVFLAAGYRASSIEKFVGDGSRWGLQIQIATETQPLGTAGAIAQFAAAWWPVPCDERRHPHRSRSRRIL